MAGSWWRGASRDSLIWGCRVGTSSRGPWMGWSPLLHPVLPSPLISSSHPPHHWRARRDLKGAPLTSRPYFAAGRRRPGSGGLCLVQEGLPGRGGVGGKTARSDAASHRCILSTGLAASGVPSPAPRLRPSSAAFTMVCDFSPSCACFPEARPRAGGAQYTLCERALPRRCHHSHSGGSGGRKPLQGVTWSHPPSGGAGFEPGGALIPGCTDSTEDITEAKLRSRRCPWGLGWRDLNPHV